MEDDDGTVRLVRPSEKAVGRSSLRWPLVAAAFAAGVVFTGGAWFALRGVPAREAAVVVPPSSVPPVVVGLPAPVPAPPTVQTAFAPPQPVPDPAPPPAPPPPVASPLPAPLPPLMTEADILGRKPVSLEVYRFAPAPEIVVLQFPALADQARMLNRVAGLVEKAGYPRDRVLEPAELERRIRAEGAEPDTLYYGHDYRAADVVRFFDVLRAAGQPLLEAEAVLQRMVGEWGWSRSSNAALISLVAENADAGIGPAIRATILRHELSHGLHFTSPAYAKYGHDFFNTTLTAAERQKFRTFLAGEGYDTGIEDLVVNETQAYLMHTADERFFSAGAVGIAQRRVDALRALFLTSMPAGWLRDCTTAPARAPRRRRYLRSTVRRTRTVADRRDPDRAAESSADLRSRT